MKKSMLALLLLIVCLGGSAVAAPNLINYQGVLTDNTGAPVTNANQAMTFRLYDAATAGTKLWEEARTVDVQNGSYSLLLGSVTPFPAGLFQNDSLWLEIVVGSEVLGARQRLASAPFALQAQEAQSVAPGAITSAQLDPSVVTLDQIAPSCPAGQGLFRTASGWECKPAITPQPGEAFLLPCYTGPSGTADVGICKAGRREWAGSALGNCTGEMLPTAPSCNGLDNDCNGATDCTWSLPVLPTDSISPTGTVGGTGSGHPQVAMDSNGNAIIIWLGWSGADNQVFKAEYRGSAWSLPSDGLDNLSPDGTDAQYPQLAMDDNGNAIITWQQADAATGGVTRIYKAEYRGGSWSLPSSLADNLSPGGTDAQYPQLAMDNNGNAIVTWQQSDGTKDQIFKAEYRNGSWSLPSGLSDNISPDGQYAVSPQVAMDNSGNAIIVWLQSDGTNYQIFKAEYRHGAWSLPSNLADNLSPDGTEADAPQVAMDDSGNAIVTWVQSDGSHRQVYKAEYRGGSWSLPSSLADNLSPDGTEADAPQVAMDDNGNAIITWRQADAGGIYQIYKAEYRGGSWSLPSGPDDNLRPDGAAHAFYPQVAMNNKGNAIIVWSQSDGSVIQVFKAEYGIGRWWIPAGMSDNLSQNGADAQGPQVAMDNSGNTIITWEAGAIFKAEYGFDADSDGYNVWRDCNDSSHGIHPGAMEVGGDGIDSNCDGFDYPDMDSDGFPANLDCNDIDATIYPGAFEQPCDGIDQNCNGLADDAPDLDGDGVTQCAGDCNDNDPTVYPGATEVICDGIDQNCNGLADDEPDADGDGVSLCAGDCDDTDPDTFPGQTGWFSTTNAGGSFDYDCNGLEEMQFPTSSTVMPYPDCLLTSGWDQTIPACGMSGNYINSATPNSSTLSCDTSFVVQTQACH